MRPIEFAFRRLLRAAAWKCAYAAVLMVCAVMALVTLLVDDLAEHRRGPPQPTEAAGARLGEWPP